MHDDQFCRILYYEPRVTGIRLIGHRPYIAVGNTDDQLSNPKSVSSIDETCPKCGNIVPVMLFNTQDNGYYCHLCNLHWWWVELICPRCDSPLIKSAGTDLYECEQGCFSPWLDDILLTLYDTKKYFPHRSRYKTTQPSVRTRADRPSSIESPVDHLGDLLSRLKGGVS